MKQFYHLLLLLSWLSSSAALAQPVMESVEDAYMATGGRIFSHRLYLAGIVEYDGEDIPWYKIDPVYIFPKLIFANEAEARRYYQIANNIKKVYPIAVQISYDVKHHIAHLDSLEEKKDRDTYMKAMEKELKKKYTPVCKKLTLTQGKLLIKLIDRQCDQTAFKLVRSYMGSFKATFYNTFASIFGASLKKQYDPEVDDRLTERCILLIESGQM